MNFQITSVVSDNKIKISELVAEYFTVTVSGHVNASLRVCTYTDERGLLALLSKAAKARKPWRGALMWQSLEGQLTVEATCSALGKVLFVVQLAHTSGDSDLWSVELGITAELGDMPRIFAEAKDFFDANHER